ncbi:hypothetical protein M378DRAFT_87324 [Amanita muscaria Koide BX008]|uniref:Uncharacterized protein n=1 Tax=Amanita muscaria (strain Koide BX008) TaxID=946122 RepID=A0A0C2SUX8_AMAMK|nr:hypothetical protein M378DRAFT_87324 [Amanita muscaria Koide BX008]
MSWPEPITLQFELIDKLTTDEGAYYGPFISLLHTLFPGSKHYQVSPMFDPIADSIGFTVIYLNARRKVPLLFLEMNNDVAYDSDDARKAADNQLRGFFEVLGGCIPIPKLYSISALGTRICIYEYTVASRSLTPLPTTPPNTEVVADVAPKERWNLDIMEPQGEARLREIVGDIKAMVADLNWNCIFFHSLSEPS